jgi:ketosteroid isomerase-like protein
VSEQDLELVRRVMEAVAGGDPQAALQHVDPAVEFDARVRPDGKVWHGHDGLRQALFEWTQTWSDWELENERYIDAGAGRVVVLWRETGRARASGALISQEGATVLTLRDGMIVSALISIDRRRTLAALGLEE